MQNEVPMATTSQLINFSLRRHVTPVLRDAGFQKVDARNGWRPHDKVVWVFNIRAVGNYFSKVTGWPPGSVNVWLGCYYTFMPQSPKIKRDKLGRLQPAEYECQMRSHLECGRDQAQMVQSLRNPAERRRKDIWWVEPDGKDADEVAKDIGISLSKDGLPWYSLNSNLETALEKFEKRNDCFVKFAKAAFLARELGYTERWQKFDSLAEAEAKRIGKNLDRNTWY
jgi:hypothetical protein